MKNLVISDIFVALFCGSIWGIPRGQDYYSRFIFPFIAPYLITLSHINVLCSNLFTGLLGFERFIRLRYTCNFRNKNWLTNKNINYYRAGIIIFATLFYLPKFFEIRAIEQQKPCSEVILQGYEEITTLYHKLANHGVLEKIKQPKQTDYDMEVLKNTRYCLSSALAKNKMYTVTYFRVGATKMRLNENYYKWYFMGANTIIGYLVPFSLIFGLNVFIVHMLRKATKQSNQLIQDSPTSLTNRGGKQTTLTTNAETTPPPPASAPDKKMMKSRRDTTESEIEPFSDFSRRSSNIEKDLDQIFRDENNEHQTGAVILIRIPSQRGLVRHGPSNGRSGRRQDRRLTMISFYIMIMYVFTHIWKLIPNCYDAIYGYESSDAILPEWPRWLEVIKDVSHIMVVCNSAFNFLPYLLY